MHSQLIIIRGPLGVGKTTVAKMLAQHMVGAYFSIDQVLEDHKLDQPEDHRGIPLKNFLQANDYLIPQIKGQQANKKPVIVDGNFYHKEQLDNLLRDVGGKHTVFTLKASLKTCLQRDSERQEPHGPDATEAVYGMVTAFDYGNIVETDRVTPHETVGMVLDLIKLH